MSLVREERGQLGPFEELYELILVVILLFVFSSAVARSYIKYDERKDAVDRFSASIDFSWRIKNNILSLQVNGVPNPGLLSDEVLAEKGNFVFIDQFWDKPYSWEILIRDLEGALLYEFGSLNKDSRKPKAPKVKLEKFDFGEGVSVAYSPIALRHADGSTELARLEVWVW